MAGFFQGVDKALTNLSQSPVGMAGMGLLMMPQQSLTPINPFEYAAQGMQMGAQNRQRAQTLSALQERQRQEDEYRRMEYLMQAQQYQQEQLDRAEAQRMAEEQAKNFEAYLSTKTPEEQILARAAGPEYIKRDINARFPSETPGERYANALGLPPNSPERTNFLREYTLRPKNQINIGGKPLSAAELARLQTPSGELLPFGTTPEQAIEMGATVAPKAPTEGQSVSAGFYERMLQSNSIITPERERLLADATEAIAAGVPMIGNYFSSPEYQLARQAQENFVTANLRKESGAVISKEEMDKEIRKYFPQPGDFQQVIDQKRLAREAAINAMRRNAGRALKNQQGPTGQQQETPEDIARRYLQQ